MRFENKIAVVASTGGSIGVTCAKMLQEEGAKVAFLGSCSKEISSMEKNETCLPIEISDFSDETTMEDAVAQIKNTFGTIDVVVTALTCPPPKGKWNELEESVLKLTIDTILTGNCNILKYTLPPMVEKECGRVVLITSIAGRTGIAGSNLATTTAYAGIGGIIRDVATVFGKHSITCNGVAVGPIEGQYFEEEAAASVQGVQNRKGTAKDVAYAVMYLADDLGKWNTGEIIDLNGGYFSV